MVPGGGWGALLGGFEPCSWNVAGVAMAALGNGRLSLGETKVDVKWVVTDKTLIYKP